MGSKQNGGAYSSVARGRAAAEEEPTLVIQLHSTSSAEHSFLLLLTLWGAQKMEGAI